ncbi:MAG: hypothetical protein DRO10_02590 [Thermoprotei archaeon]|nr:MAG: hypothetical protein DRO10_02590 [Thermoprotei archaeon]
MNPFIRTSVSKGLRTHAFAPVERLTWAPHSLPMTSSVSMDPLSVLILLPLTARKRTDLLSSI